ncbi:MAG: hypothetical protein ACLPSL_07810 [Smithella sp.]
MKNNDNFREKINLIYDDNFYSFKFKILLFESAKYLKHKEREKWHQRVKM